MDISKISINGTSYNIADTITTINGKTGAIDASDIVSVLNDGGYDLSSNVSYSAGDGISIANGVISASFSGSYTDLTDKPTIPAAQIQSDWDQSDSSAKDYIKNKPTIPSLSGYATEQWVTNKGYLTSHQSLTDYATKTFVDNKFKDAFGINASGVSDLAAILSDEDYTTGILNVIANKVDKNGTDRLMTAAEGTKLSGIESGAQVHKAPTSTEVKTALGTGSGTSKYLREDGTWQTPPNDNTTYSAATTSAAGLMSAADKTKLNGIATGATANTGTITKVGNTSSGDVTVSSSNNTASFGSAVTVGTVGGIDLKFTMPADPNTDTEVSLSNSSTTSWRNILLHNTTISAATTAVPTATGAVYGAAGVAVQPSSATILAKKFKTYNGTSSLFVKGDGSLDNNTYALSSAIPTLASLMGSVAIGGTTQPIYWDGSAFVNTTYTLGKSVPSDAVFTDTTYSEATTTDAGLMSAVDKTALSRITPITRRTYNSSASAQYTFFASAPSNTTSRYNDCTVLINGLGYYYGAQKNGTYIIEIQTSSASAPSMLATVLSPKGSTGTVTFGYYKDTEAGKIYWGVYTSTRHNTIQVTPIYKANANIEILETPIMVTTAPEGWTTIDTREYLTAHQTVTDSTTNLAWGTTSTVGSVGGTNLTVTMPADPTTGLQSKIPTATGNTTGTVALDCDKMYNLGTLTGNLTLTLNAAPDSDYMHEWMVAFDMGSTLRTVTWPSGVSFPSTPTLEKNKHYEVNIKGNYALIASW